MATELQSDQVFQSTILVVVNDRDRGAELAASIGSGGFAVSVLGSATELLSRLNRIESAVILIDSALPGCLDLVSRIGAVPASPPVIVMTDTVEFDSVVRAFRSGALDLLELPVGRRLLLERVNRAALEDSRRAKRRRLYQRLRRLIGSLTPRERQVMHCVVEGNANKQIAADLGISEKTVEVHRHKVMRKMEADSLADLVRMNVVMESTAIGLSL